MRLRVKLRLLLQLLIDGSEVTAHQSALVRLGTTRVDERQDKRLAAILRQMNSFSILIQEAEIRNVVTGFRFDDTITGFGVRVGDSFFGDYHVFKPRRNTVNH